MAQAYKNIWLWIGVAAAITLSTFVILSGNNPSGSSGNGAGAGTGSGELASTVQSDDWTKGADGASVVIVEYGDFQCPACASYLPYVEAIMGEFGDHVTFVYRNFPLRSIHPNAQIAGQAAEAAGLQGEFWAMHDILFERQGEWSSLSDPREKFVEYAEELGLNTANFENDMDSSEAKDGVDDDYSGGLGLGLNSTPTFFLQGERIRPQSLEEFRALVREAVQSADDGNADEGENVEG